jgi:hypothetical protein
MKDILGKPVHEYDLVIAKGLGTTYVGVDIGIVVGGQIRTEESTHPMFGCYLIREPSAEELEIKNRILTQMAKEKADAAALKETRKNQKANIVGTIYKTSTGEFIYCGKKKVKIVYEDLTANKSVGLLDKVGNMYFPTDYYTAGMTFNDLITERVKRRCYSSSYGRGYIVDDHVVMKGVKSFDAIVGHIDVPAKFEMEYKYHNAWVAERGRGPWPYEPIDHKFTVTVEDA